MSEDITIKAEVQTDNTPPPSNNQDSGENNFQESRFEQGQDLRYVRVRFPGHARSYSFHIGKRELTYGQKVVALSDRGLTVGYVNSFPYIIPFDKSMLPIKSINKVATDEDLTKQVDVYQKERDYENLCKDLIRKYELDMNLTHVEFTQFGKKVVFYFTAPARVDFRELVKDLVTSLKLRIELRQISVRDRAAAVGGIGPCGRQLCCSSFLGKYGSVNIKMAKNQNLTLTYGKLNGVCGQLKCCLQYEDQVYDNKRKALPNEGKLIECHNGDKGRVDRLHILSEQYDILTDRGVVRRYSIDQFKGYVDADYRFPRQFDHISNETSTVVGLSDYQAQKAKEFEKTIEEIKTKGEVQAQVIFEDLFGVETFTEPEEFEKYKEQKEEKKQEEIKAQEELVKRQQDYFSTSSVHTPQEASTSSQETPKREEHKREPGQNKNRNNNNRNRNNNKNRNRNNRNNNRPKGNSKPE